MAYEYRSRHGMVRLTRAGQTWRVRLGTDQAGDWPSAEAALFALVRQSSGIPRLDHAGYADLPEDLMAWTPLADNL